MINDEAGTGSYILIIHLPMAHSITVGSLGEIYFAPGWYAYVGSAMRGFRSRLPHYLREIKKPHWHIDFLLQVASIKRIIAFGSTTRMECEIAQTLMQRLEPVPGFGCSDCTCGSHLLYAGVRRKLKSGMNQLDLVQAKLARREIPVK